VIFTIGHSNLAPADGSGHSPREQKYPRLLFNHFALLHPPEA